MKQHFIAKGYQTLSLTVISVVKVRLSLMCPYVTKSKGSSYSQCCRGNFRLISLLQSLMEKLLVVKLEMDQKSQRTMTPDKVRYCNRIRQGKIIMISNIRSSPHEVCNQT